MTVRTLNYTHRRRLRREDVDIVIFANEFGDHIFDAALSIDKYELPGSARVFMEAYRQTHWMRFDFGKVEAIAPPRDRSLSIFENIDGILFRVRVTANADPQGLLLAEGDRLPFRSKDERPKKRIPLLPVVPEYLQDEICKVSYEGSGPELVVNSSLGNWSGLARDPVVIALLYPFVLRDVLSRICFLEDDFDPDDRTDWRSRWCKFAELLPGMEEYPENKDDREEWIEKAVAAFSRRVSILTKFGLYWKEGAFQ